MNAIEVIQRKVILKPSEPQFEAVEELQTAVDLLIVKDCFMGNNPIRQKPDAVLWWNWAIIEFENGFQIPVPYNPKNKTESHLYTCNGEEVILSHTDCVLCCGAFYMSHLNQIKRQFEGKKLHPLIDVALTPAFEKIQEIGTDTWVAMYESLAGNNEDIRRVLD